MCVYFWPGMRPAHNKNSIFSSLSLSRFFHFWEERHKRAKKEQWNRRACTGSDDLTFSGNINGLGQTIEFPDEMKIKEKEKGTAWWRYKWAAHWAVPQVLVTSVTPYKYKRETLRRKTKKRNTSKTLGIGFHRPRDVTEAFTMDSLLIFCFGLRAQPFEFCLYIKLRLLSHATTFRPVRVVRDTNYATITDNVSLILCVCVRAVAELSETVSQRPPWQGKKHPLDVYT